MDPLSLVPGQFIFHRIVKVLLHKRKLQSLVKSEHELPTRHVQGCQEEDGGDQGGVSPGALARSWLWHWALGPAVLLSPLLIANMTSLRSSFQRQLWRETLTCPAWSASLLATGRPAPSLHRLPLCLCCSLHL